MRSLKESLAKGCWVEHPDRDEAFIPLGSGSKNPLAVDLNVSVRASSDHVRTLAIELFASDGFGGMGNAGMHEGSRAALLDALAITADDIQAAQEAHRRAVIEGGR